MQRLNAENEIFTALNRAIYGQQFKLYTQNIKEINKVENHNN